MCLIAFALDAHPHYRLVLAGNRDEFYHRPAEPAAWWSDEPGVLAGRDAQAQGTWLGIHRSGRIAALTNVREGGRPSPPGLSRGALPCDVLRGNASPIEHAERLAGNPGSRSADYAGFNLLMFQLDRAGTKAGWMSNRHPTPRTLVAGVHGLSNHLLDTPWPKVTGLKAALQQALTAPGPASLESQLFAALADARAASDEHLPGTGLPIERERLLSAAFIRSPDYGTRASTVLLVGRDGSVELIERSWDSPGPSAPRWQERRHGFSLD